MTDRRTLSWGLLVACAYVVVALTVPGRPTRPLFDAGPGLQPYRWVCPSTVYAPGNVAPRSATHAVPLTASGSGAASYATPDGQGAIVLRENTFAPRRGETQITVTIDPLCPDTIGPPPAGQRYDGNAYRFTATYARSKAVATPAQPITIVLRFPIVATRLFRRDGDAWTDLNAQPVAASLQIFTDASTKLGVFVAVGPPLDLGSPKKKSSVPAALIVSLSAGVAAVVAGLVARMRVRKRRREAQQRPRGRPRDRRR
jgi:hypothetical protein